MNSYKNILALEFKNCLRGKRVRFVFCFLLFMITIGFLSTCKHYHGGLLSEIRSAYAIGFQKGRNFGIIKYYIICVLPLIGSIIYSDSFISEYNSGVYKNIITRIDKKKYLISKIIVIFTVVFLTIFIALTISELLCLIAFPKEGIDNNFACPSYDIGYQNYRPQKFLDIVRLQCPYVYNFIFIGIVSLFGGLLSTLSYSISLVVKWKRIFILTFVFIIYNVYNRILPWEIAYFTISELLRGGFRVNFYIFIILILLVLIPQIILFRKGFKRELY